MVSIGYASIFNQVEQITEGGDKNEGIHVEAKVMTTREIYSKNKK